MEKNSSLYSARIKRVIEWMSQESIDLLMLEDTEVRRDQNIRWLTGHPGDALFFISLNDKPLLVPWDVNLAKLFACKMPLLIAPYNDFGRKPINALLAAAKLLNIPSGAKIEIPSITPYPAFLNFVGEVSDYDILCRESGSSAEMLKLRSVKDDEEIAVMRKAANITNELIALIEEKVRSEKIKTEADAAMFIQIEARKMGCEGTSFETLAAGANRSYAIHAFPSWTCAPFGEQGLSILDFGVQYNGYCTDVTLTFTRNLNPKQEKLVCLVEKASKLALSMANKGTQTREIAVAVDSLFSKSKKTMPHSLGHGVGLQAHEYPLFRNSSDNEWTLEPGMVITLEPGLYDPMLGGCRLENTILITDAAPEVLTTAKIIHL